jgi:hypothetical protein
MTDNNNKFELTEFESEYIENCLEWLYKIHGCASTNYASEMALIGSYNVFNGIHLQRETANRIAFAMEGDNRFTKYVPMSLKDDENFHEEKPFNPREEYE